MFGIAYHQPVSVSLVFLSMSMLSQLILRIATSLCNKSIIHYLKAT